MKSDEQLTKYVSNHREDLHYALREGDKWVRTVVIAALLAAGDAEAELAKVELERELKRSREEETAPS